MTVGLDVRNESSHKRVYTRPNLQHIAERICTGEGVHGAVELSVLFCSDPFIRKLNEQFRNVDSPTDVLSFSQADAPGGTKRVLGDIVISLDTVHRRSRGDRARMREEVRLLFCHGVLHLLGEDHATEASRRAMAAKQAAYLDVPAEEAWIADPAEHVSVKA